MFALGKRTFSNANLRKFCTNYNRLEMKKLGYLPEQNKTNININSKLMKKKIYKNNIK
jgi:hypothetical protein